MTYHAGDIVYWNWLGREISGSVREVYFSRITREIKGKQISRNGSAENPAYLVESKAGNLALKLHSELRRKSGGMARKNKRPSPKIFEEK